MFDNYIIEFLILITVTSSNFPFKVVVSDDSIKKFFESEIVDKVSFNLKVSTLLDIVCPDNLKKTIQQKLIFRHLLLNIHRQNMIFCKKG